MRGRKEKGARVLWENKQDYNKMFASPEKTRHYIYGNPARTADIIFSEEFVMALCNSPHARQVDMIIRQKAFERDRPSVRYMINLLGILKNELPDQIRDRQALNEAIKALLKERIGFCAIAVELGDIEQSYYGLTSSVALHSLMIASCDNGVKEALDNIVAFGEIFLSADDQDVELVREVEEAMKHWRPQQQLFDQVFDENGVMRS